jgi:hypothetical protein
VISSLLIVSSSSILRPFEGDILTLPKGDSTTLGTKRLSLTALPLEFIMPFAVFLDSSIRQSGRLLTARFQVRVLVEELLPLSPRCKPGVFV